MKRILILSVGGSPEPVINAIQFYQPHFVYFFCSAGSKGSAITVDGSGDPCGDKRTSTCPECGHTFPLGNPKGKAIVFQTGLDKDAYEIIEVHDPDNLDECYSKLVALSETITTTYPSAQVIANYTGGTKTMSVAMALVGTITEQWDLSLNKGPRLDIIKVRTGDTPVVLNKWRIVGKQRFEWVARALASYDYALAESIVGEMLLHPLDPGFEQRLLRLKQICAAFNHWDKFDHTVALDLLQPYGRDYSAYMITLKKILKTTRGNGYELVADLLNNAERRAAQQRYDDAVARLYRATELLAQIRLEEVKGYTLGKVELKDLPESIRSEYRDSVGSGDTLMLGLREDYELLYKLRDPVGEIFKMREGRIIDALSYRNSSIFAHGIHPLRQEDYGLVSERLKGYIREAAEKIHLDIGIRQLPTEEILE